MIYIASPYSTPIASVLADRVAAVTQFTCALVQQGMPAFSPIVYFHPMARALNMPTDAKYWHNMNMAFLRQCEVIFALRLMGWEQSKGMKVELNTAKILNIPVVHYGPDFREIQ